VTSSGFELRRVYDPSPLGAGRRVLVDRLWPRGIAKAELQLDQWAKDVAPSTDLRQWFGHDPAKFEAFADRYRLELGQPPAASLVDQLTDAAAHERVVLLTATRDLEHSGGSVLLSFLEARSR
jgi:uncharacterized protein YeaO (DUF488 family)